VTTWVEELATRVEGLNVLTLAFAVGDIAIEAIYQLATIAYRTGVAIITFVGIAFRVEELATGGLRLWFFTMTFTMWDITRWSKDDYTTVSDRIGVTIVTGVGLALGVEDVTAGLDRLGLFATAFAAHDVAIYDSPLAAVVTGLVKAIVTKLGFTLGIEDVGTRVIVKDGLQIRRDILFERFGVVIGTGISACATGHATATRIDTIIGLVRINLSQSTGRLNLFFDTFAVEFRAL
tara:strand:+ start:217 stop:921 length:705 start_codon:yes stop_codon:yes gene_type:complete